MRWRKAAFTVLLLLATIPACVLLGFMAAAIFGAEYGANASRSALGFMAGIIIGARHIAAQGTSAREG